MPAVASSIAIGLERTGSPLGKAGRLQLLRNEEEEDRMEVTEQEREGYETTSVRFLLQASYGAGLAAQRKKHFAKSAKVCFEKKLLFNHYSAIFQLFQRGILQYKLTCTPREQAVQKKHNWGEKKNLIALLTTLYGGTLSRKEGRGFSFTNGRTRKKEVPANH